MAKGRRQSGYAALIVSALLAQPQGATAQVLPQVQDPLRGTLDQLDRTRERLEERARRRAEAAAQAAEEIGDETGEVVDEATGEAVEAGAAALQTTGQAVDDTAGVVAQTAAAATNATARVLRAFELDASPEGWPVEARTVVALLEDDQLTNLEASGLDIVSEKALPGIGRTLVTFREPTNAPLETTLDTLRTTWPDAPADYNHIYRLQTSQASAEPAAETANETPAGESSLDIGLIDSAVEPTHFSLNGATLTAASFVDHEGSEPVSHGTAVASLLHRSAEGRARIRSASVFFQTPTYAPGATTESLVAALDWLATEEVDVINMSLAGPANALLEAAIAALRESGPVIVAAVGNNGPGGEPMYPAAYDGVIGVTAVDRDKDIYLYANRGDYVDFAALGVNVKVADAGAGWRIESGTSMASPVVAVIAAGLRRQGLVSAGDIVNRLSATAEDLGTAGFDPVYGHGLVTGQPVLVTKE